VGSDVKDVIQLCYAVKNLEEACHHFVDTEGVGPFFVAGFDDLDVIYRGRPAKESLRFALGYRGTTQYELIETDFPLYEELRGTREIAFHHVKRATLTFDEDVARFRSAGCPPILEVPGTGVCYLDTLQTLGHYIELLDYSPTKMGNPGNLARVALIQQASVGWTGEDPIRPIEIPRDLR